MSPAAFTIAAAVLLLLAVAAQRGALLAELGGPDLVDLGDDGAEQGQGGVALQVSAALGALDVSPYLAPEVGSGANLSAFLAMIRRAEVGTSAEVGYRTMFGGRTFADYSDHPRQVARVPTADGSVLWTSAAGGYQFMAVSPIPGGGSTRVDTWDRLAARLALPDFSPASQDAAAVELLREAGALDDVVAGRFDPAVSKVRRIWASMPGAGYAQPERSLAALRAIYAAEGGAFA